MASTHVSAMLIPETRPDSGFDIIKFYFRRLIRGSLSFTFSAHTGRLTLTTMFLRTQQLKAVWHQPVQADTEGTVSLISIVKLRDARTERHLNLTEIRACPQPLSLPDSQRHW